MMRWRRTIDSADCIPFGVSSISLRPFMRTSPSRVMRRKPTATVGRLTPSQSASLALRSGSFSDHM